MEKNEIYDVTIESYNSEANGVARIEGRAVFVPYAKIGEKHRVKILKVTSSAIWAKSLNDYAETDCPYFYKCGGCDCRHMSYKEELEFKLKKVNDALVRIGKQQVTAKEIFPSPVIDRYRNKAIFNCEGNAFGFYRQRSHSLIPIDDCLLQSELSINCAKKIAECNNPHIHNIFVRDTVCTVVADDFIKPIRADGITGEALCLNKGRLNSILNGDIIPLYGNINLIESLCGFEFEISPKSFFQVNPLQAENLYKKAVEMAGHGDRVLELYCGTGTISLLLSRNFKEVIATEIVPEAIENAISNAERNGIDNVQFFCRDACEIDCDADVFVVDPPRKGMSKETVDAILRCSPSKLVYISCNPATLARDIDLLTDYSLVEAVAFDMFPRTKHVETVCLMERHQ